MRLGFFRPRPFPLSIPVLSFLRFPFSAHCFVSQALHSRRPPVSSSAAPLAFALGSGYLALSFWVLVPRSDLTYISTNNQKCQHLFFIFFNSFLASRYHFYPKTVFSIYSVTCHSYKIRLRSAERKTVSPEVGVNLQSGYNGHLTSREAGSVGGQMVTKIWSVQPARFDRKCRTNVGHRQTVQYIAAITI